MDFNAITACGETCVGCKKKEAGLCPGCVEADGYVPEWKESGRCRVHTCARAHGVRFCGVCGAFPCPGLGAMLHWQPDPEGRMRALASVYREWEGK